MWQTIHGDCTELFMFVNTFLYAYRILFPISCLLYSSSSQKAWTRSIISWAIALPFFWEGCASIPFFASGFLQIEFNTVKLQSIQNNTFVTKNQEPKSIFAIFWIWNGDKFLIHSSMQSVKLLSFIFGISVIYWRWFFNFYIQNISSRNILLVHI